MRIFHSELPLRWGELDLPVLGLTADWYRRALHPPLGFVVATDPASLWFLATRQAAAICLPGAETGDFVEGLWGYDVAELFLGDAESGKYLEFNLAANGAWWAAKFTAPRVRAEVQPDFRSAVAAHGEEISGGGWCAAIRVPLAFLESEIGFGERTTANVTAILNSPRQTFHSAANLPGVEPDFHQPAAFPPIVPWQM